MSSDIDLLRQKRALELRRKMLLSQQKPGDVVKPVKADPSETVRSILTGRGSEVLETARRHFPNEVREVERNLAELIESGRLKGPVSGEQFYAFLRRIGLPFNMDVTIRVKEHGELKSLEEKFRHSSG
jgi:DNA-binding TFAR19-related protein (PDSD5 family)